MQTMHQKIIALCHITGACMTDTDIPPACRNDTIIACMRWRCDSVSIFLEMTSFRYIEYIQNQSGLYLY